MTLVQSNNIYWDACVFVRYLTRTPTDLLDDIDSYVEDVKKGTRKIYTSTLTLAEVRPSHMKGSNHDSFHEFVNDFIGAIELIDTNPVIMTETSKAKDAIAKNPNGSEKNRQLSTPDAIHLNSCIYIRDVMDVKDIVMHTFDEGSNRGIDGRAVPVLKIKDWYNYSPLDKVMQEICSLKIGRPFHPQPNFQLRGGA